MAHEPGDETLKKGLKQRHLTMIAIGGVIGAGLFVGSGAIIGEVGPAAFLTYALTGVLIVMVMRMLGEMAVANPSTGSFADYARQALGGWAGFSVGWLYWYFWVIVVGFEAVAGAGILQRWLPDIPLWLLSLVLMLLMTATNLFSVTSYGEFEYWFAGVKVATIMAFILLGSCSAYGRSSSAGSARRATRTRACDGHNARRRISASTRPVS
jgi:GABA permease